jgi:hypothetical protein
MESTPGPQSELAKRVFNERQFTQFSREKLAEFTQAVDTSLPTIKDILRAKHVGAFTFGSAAIGIATDKVSTDTTRIPRSDVDIFFVYEGAHPTTINTPDSLFRVAGNHNGELEEQLKTVCPDITVYNAIPADSIQHILDTMKNGNIASYGEITSARFFLYTLTNILLTKHAGDSDFIQRVKTNIIHQLQSFGEPGEQIWEQMNSIFKTEAVNYGDFVEEYGPRKRQKRLDHAIDQVLEQRNIPQEKRSLAVKIMKQQKENIGLPPLSEAETLI